MLGRILLNLCAGLSVGLLQAGIDLLLLLQAGETLRVITPASDL